MINAVVLDGQTLTQSDLHWDEMQKICKLTVYDRTSLGQLIDRAAMAEALITNKTIIDAEAMRQLPRLSYIGVLATGYNVVDIQEAKRRGIVVTNIPAYSTMSVAQMVFAHILNITQSVATYALQNRSGRWSASTDFCYCTTPLTELSGKTMGIVGLGNTGMSVAQIALSFGMKVLAVTTKSQHALPQGVTACKLSQLLSLSDVVSLHCPLNEQTYNIINSQTLGLMRPSAILINTARGPLIDEQALSVALRDGRIAAAGLDVLSQEPPAEDNPLLNLPNCFVTPHIAWATAEARRRLMQIAVDNLKAFLSGAPRNNVAQ